ncbi:SRPBCC family protein [Bosea sp. NPDC055332]
MTALDLQPATQDIVVDEVLPHAPEVIWKALTSSTLIARWIMEPTGFVPVEGTRFTFKTTPAGAWDGTIRCQMLEVIPNERLAYSWKGGDDGNAGYGSRLDTVVTWTLTRNANGTRVRLVHSGFELPRNEIAFTNMGRGWKTILPRLGDVAGEPA